MQENCTFCFCLFYPSYLIPTAPVRLKLTELMGLKEGKIVDSRKKKTDFSFPLLVHFFFINKMTILPLFDH